MGLFFPSTVPHPDAVTVEAPLPSCAFVLRYISQVLLVSTFLTLFLKFVSLKNILIFALYFYLHDLIQFDFGNFSLPLCFLTSDTALSLMSSPSFPFLTYTLLSPKNPLFGDLFFCSWIGTHSADISPTLFGGWSVPTFFFFHLCHTDILSFSQVCSWALLSKLASMPSSLDSSKLMGNWKDEFLCFPKSPLHDYNRLQSCFHWALIATYSV